MNARFFMFFLILWLFMDAPGVLAYQAPDAAALEWAEAQMKQITDNPPPRLPSRMAAPAFESIHIGKRMGYDTQPPLTAIDKISSSSPPQLWIFVSFSLPESSLKAWLMQAKQAGGVLVLRGLIHDSFPETVQRITHLLDGQAGGFQIDPLLFKRYAIERVPAVVVVDQDRSDVVYGDVPLDSALETLAKQGTLRPSVIQPFLFRPTL